MLSALSACERAVDQTISRLTSKFRLITRDGRRKRADSGTFHLSFRETTPNPIANASASQEDAPSESVKVSFTVKLNAASDYRFIIVSCDLLITVS